MTTASEAWERLREEQSADCEGGDCVCASIAFDLLGPTLEALEAVYEEYLSLWAIHEGLNRQEVHDAVRVRDVLADARRRIEEALGDG